MVNSAQILSWGIVLAVLGGGLYAMNMFFGMVGVVLTVGMTVVVVAIVALLARSGSSGGTATQTQGRTSKGAQQNEE